MSKIAGIAIPARRNAKVWTDDKDRPIRKGGSPGNSHSKQRGLARNA